MSLVATSLAGCTHNSPGAAPAPPQPVSITVSPKTALIDVPVTVTVTGLSPGQQVTLRSSAADYENQRWTGAARFRVPADGTVTTGDASLGGSYTGVDPMGLFESMMPPATDGVSAFQGSGSGYDVSVRAEVAGTTVARATTRRVYPIASRIQRQTLRPGADAIYGELDLPTSPDGRKPAVLVFGGSEGGLSELVLLQARLLAAHGYPALALAYFDESGLPHGLENIPLEYFVKALRILRKQPGVDPRHVLVDGDSRGSEAALLLGADFPKLVDGVIAGSPSAIVNGSYPTPGQPAWTLHGKPIRPIEPGEPGESDNPATFATSGAVIPVEKIHGPVMLVCGGLDDIWISCPYQQLIVKRLRAHHFRYPVTAQSYQQAGHYVGAMSAYWSATPVYYQGGGGTLMANQQAAAQAHAQLLRFLASQ